MDLVESVAQSFHDVYERLAPEFGWKTQAQSRKSWEEVPDENKELMKSVVAILVKHDVIRFGPNAGKEVFRKE